MDIELYAWRLALAILVGGLIGLERQLHKTTAGVRTHALVAAGSASFVMAAPLIHGDPAAQGRILSYVVSGVGFLCAGVIFKDHGQVYGLNTAATIWCAAAVGVFAGIGSPVHSAVTAAAVLVVSLMPHQHDHKHEPAPALQDGNYRFELVCSAEEEAGMRFLLLRTLDRSQVSLCELQSEQFEGNGHRRLHAALKTPTRDDRSVEDVAARFSMERSVLSVSWRRLPDRAPA